MQVISPKVTKNKGQKEVTHWQHRCPAGGGRSSRNPADWPAGTAERPVLGDDDVPSAAAAGDDDDDGDDDDHGADDDDGLELELADGRDNLALGDAPNQQQRHVGRRRPRGELASIVKFFASVALGVLLTLLVVFSVGRGDSGDGGGHHSRQTVARDLIAEGVDVACADGRFWRSAAVEVVRTAQRLRETPKIFVCPLHVSSSS
jgi:hypothetical protein